MWWHWKKSMDIVPIFSDIGNCLHYTGKFSSIFMIYRNLSEAKYGKDLHWVEEWDKTSKNGTFYRCHLRRQLLSGLFYRRSASFSSIDWIVREGKRRGCAFPFPNNFRNKTWSIMKLFSPLSYWFSFTSYRSFLRQRFNSRSKVKVGMSLWWKETRAIGFRSG